MTKTRFSLFATATATLVAALAVSTNAQAPQPAPAANPPSQNAGGPPPPPRTFPKPTNLKVLPKDLDGKQVRDIMEGWEAALGGNCATCHMPDPKNIGPNGRPRLNFADDSKPEKQVARMMYKMTEDVNGNYVSMIKENSGVAVTCGTCHRGKVTPEPFVAPPENHEHHGPAPSGQPAATGQSVGQH